VSDPDCLLIKELVPGQRLEVASDDEGIKKDMPGWSETIGHEWVGLEEKNGTDKTIYKAYVKKS
jgi:tRNA 2-thiouridine synthesizing protein A